MLVFIFAFAGDISPRRGRGTEHKEAVEHARPSPVESVFRGAEECVCNHLPPSFSNAQESMCSAGRPVFNQCNAGHEDPDGAVAGGTAAVSDIHKSTSCFSRTVYYTRKLSLSIIYYSM